MGAFPIHPSQNADCSDQAVYAESLTRRQAKNEITRLSLSIVSPVCALMAKSLGSSNPLFSCLQFDCDPVPSFGRNLKLSLLQSPGRCFSPWSIKSSFSSGRYARSSVFPGELLFILASIPSDTIITFHCHLGYLFQRCTIHSSAGISECGVNGCFDKMGSKATVITPAA